MDNTQPRKTLLLIDGHSILHRAYHAFPKSLQTSDGELTNAVYGFTRILLSVLKKFNSQYAAVSFDTKEPTFRHQEFAPYKEHRPEMEAELAGQIARVHEVVEILGIPIFEVPGYEADDVIGSLAEQVNHANERESDSESTRIREASIGEKELSSRHSGASPKGAAIESRPEGPDGNASFGELVEVIIVTDDMDMLQLVENGTKVYMPKKDKLWDREAVEKKYGFPPEKVDDYKALRGDPSDNIPGVRGIGPKTAKNLLSEFDSMEEVYKNLSKVENERVRNLLAESAEQAALSKKLATIVRDVPIKLDLDKCRVQDFDPERVKELFEKLEFKSLLKQLPGANGDAQIALF